MKSAYEVALISDGLGIAWTIFANSEREALIEYIKNYCKDSVNTTSIFEIDDFIKSNDFHIELVM